MKRVGILLLLAALSASAQMRSTAGQRGPGSMSGGRGFAPSAPQRSTRPGWDSGYRFAGNGFNHGWNNSGVRVGNWTFRTGPPRRGCPGFNCFNYGYQPGYGYYPSYYPVITVPYYPTYGMSVYDMQAQQQQEPQYVYADNGASQTSAYDAGYSAAMAQVATQAATSSRYGDHYLDSRENAQPEQSSITVTQGAPAPPRPATSQSPVPISPATVLVFKDGHTAEVHNYAIIGTTLWNLSETQARKIPLSDLDLDATVKVNDDRGVTFKLPATHN